VTEIKNKELVEYGVNGYFGRHYELGKTSLIETNHTIAGINPFIKYDIKWFGIGGGLHVGNLRYAPMNWSEDESSKFPDTGTRESPVLPMLYFRIGIQRTLFVSYKFADQFPTPFPGHYQNIEVGSGFGAKNGFNIRYGSDGQTKNHIAAYIPINENNVFEPLYGWVSNEDINTSIQQQFVFGLHYRFGYKTKTVKGKVPVNEK
jgi:hypothetical protein